MRVFALVKLSHRVTPLSPFLGVSFCVFNHSIISKAACMRVDLHSGFEEHYNELTQNKTKNKEKKRTTSWFWMSGLCASKSP